MNKIVIIDDAWERRKEIYSTVLSETNIEIVGAGIPTEAMNRLQDSDINMYIVDIVLEGWDFKTDETPVIHILGKIPKHKPILLISSQYEQLVKGEKLTRLMNEIIDKEFNVKSFLLWSDFFNATEDENAKQAILSKINFHCGLQKKQEFDFAVICALPEEMKPFIQKFSNTENLPIEGISVSKKAKLTTKTGKELKFIAVTQTNMGMVDAAILGTILTSRFEIKHLFMIGVCGGKDDNVKIGSIVMPIEIVAYQNGKITEQGLIPNVKIAKCDKSFGKQILTQENKSILNSIYTEAQNEIRTETSKGIDAELLNSVETDEMACGDVVINKKEALDEIAKQTAKPKLCAVDMESYSIYRIAELLKIDATVIKTVMDLTANKTDRYKDYAAKISAKFLYSILYEEIINL
ncbi:MAG: hypothetical protein FWG84_03200 [Bacteroidales bacterium]|nr:hypothetical protein [Bacteroidales bacterium]